MSWLMFCKKSIAFMALFMVLGVAKAVADGVCGPLTLLPDLRRPPSYCFGRGGSYFVGNYFKLLIWTSGFLLNSIDGTIYS